MILAKDSLEMKRKIIEGFTEKGFYPYTKYYLRDIKARFGVYWKNHFSTIGLIGLNEACLNLFGKNIGTPEGKDFAVEVMDFMRTTVRAFQIETGNNYNLEATPGEGTSLRLAGLDKEMYPDLICANDEDVKNGAQPFYTNSSQLPVNYTDDIFEVLDHQDDLQTKYTGGTVVHIFAGERIYDSEVMKILYVKFVKIIEYLILRSPQHLVPVQAMDIWQGNTLRVRNAVRNVKYIPELSDTSALLNSGMQVKRKNSKRESHLRFQMRQARIFARHVNRRITKIFLDRLS